MNIVDPHGFSWRCLGRLLAVAAVLLANAAPAEAVRTKFFRTEGYQGFKTCRIENAALASDGRVMPGFEAIALGDPGARTIWRLGRSAGTLYASSGDQGKVFTVADEAEVLAALHNYELFALTADGKGRIYAAGAPSGSVMRIERDGSTSTVFTAPEGLIFDLAVDSQGALLVATGERGLIYRVSDSGDAKVLTETNDLHVRRLAWSADRKTLWAGTDGRGLLLQIDPTSGEAQVAFDADEDEVVAMVPLEDGSLLFAANRSPQSASSSGSSSGSTSSASGSGGSGDGASAATARLYRRDARGSVRPLWDCPERTIHDIVLGEDGNILVATGSAGALYEVREDGLETLLWRADEEQVLCLLREGDRLFAGTGNPGRVYELSTKRVAAATIISEVLDANDQAVWGKISWEADGPDNLVQCETRSGFTSVPDETWSGWSASLTDASGSQVASPPGRYIQWRAHVRSKGDTHATLRRVRMAFIGPNRPPRIATVGISPDEASYRSDARPSQVSQVLPSGVQVDYSMPSNRANTLPPGGVPDWVKEVRSILWEADDPDRDELAFKVEIRQVGEAGFRLIEDDWRESAYTLETGILPDGMYEIRVTASDAPSNGPGMEQVAFRVTPPFRVDNAPPTVRDLKARKGPGPSLQVTGVAVDADSPVRSVEVSVDGGPFRGIQPQDGLMDSASEPFEVEVPLATELQGNWIVVQVRDAAGNQGSFRAWLEP